MRKSFWVKLLITLCNAGGVVMMLLFTGVPKTVGCFLFGLSYGMLWSMLDDEKGR